MFEESEVTKRMAEITTRFPGERQALRDAYSVFAKREAKVLLAITFSEPDLLYKQEAKDYITKAKENGVKLTVGDKEAILALELETEKVAYDLAKFDCDTSDKDYSKLEAQLSFIQSQMKLR